MLDHSQRLQALLSGGTKTSYLGQRYRMAPGHSQSWKLLLPPCGPLVRDGMCDAAGVCKNRLQSAQVITDH